MLYGKRNSGLVVGALCSRVLCHTKMLLIAKAAAFRVFSVWEPCCCEFQHWRLVGFGVSCRFGFKRWLHGCSTLCDLLGCWLFTCNPPRVFPLLEDSAKLSSAMSCNPGFHAIVQAGVDAERREEEKKLIS
ncbi:hypothetical protein ACFXTH_021040 [Malus domestica]